MIQRSQGSGPSITPATDRIITSQTSSKTSLFGSAVNAALETNISNYDKHPGEKTSIKDIPRPAPSSTNRLKQDSVPGKDAPIKDLLRPRSNLVKHDIDPDKAKQRRMTTAKNNIIATYVKLMVKGERPSLDKICQDYSEEFSPQEIDTIKKAVKDPINTEFLVKQASAILAKEYKRLALLGKEPNLKKLCETFCRDCQLDNNTLSKIFEMSIKILDPKDAYKELTGEKLPGNTTITLSDTDGWSLQRTRKIPFSNPLDKIIKAFESLIELTCTNDKVEISQDQLSRAIEKHLFPEPEPVSNAEGLIIN